MYFYLLIFFSFSPFSSKSDEDMNPECLIIQVWQILQAVFHWLQVLLHVKQVLEDRDKRDVNTEQMETETDH